MCAIVKVESVASEVVRLREHVQQCFGCFTPSLNNALIAEAVVQNLDKDVGIAFAYLNGTQSINCKDDSCSKSFRKLEDSRFRQWK
jgi:hypothetical protein